MEAGRGKAPKGKPISPLWEEGQERKSQRGGEGKGESQLILPKHFSNGGERRVNSVKEAAAASTQPPAASSAASSSAHLLSPTPIHDRRQSTRREKEAPFVDHTGER